MRSKTPLALMEQVIMVLVFALAAALCLQVFVLSSQTSRRNEAVDRAVSVCQNAAEMLKASGGDMDHAQSAAMERMGGGLFQGAWQVYYDKDWNVLPDEKNCAYRLVAQGENSSVRGLSRAKVWVSEIDSGKELFFLNVAWQEVNGNG